MQGGVASKSAVDVFVEQHEDTDEKDNVKTETGASTDAKSDSDTVRREEDPGTGTGKEEKEHKEHSVKQEKKPDDLVPASHAPGRSRNRKRVMPQTQSTSRPSAAKSLDSLRSLLEDQVSLCIQHLCSTDFDCDL